MIECLRDEIDGADSANVPVDIWLTKINPGDLAYKDHYEKGFRWSLRCSMYLPRKAMVWGETIEHLATTREELVELLQKHVIPLYETALKGLNNIVAGKQESLYYWDAEEDVK
jgi:hypothetical protein